MAKKSKAVVTPIETQQVEEVVVVVETTQVEPQVEETADEVVEVPSLLASMLNQEVKPLAEVVPENKPTTIKVDKNQGVGAFVRRLISEGMSNKDILKVVHEQYGNTNTTYACVAWYRNKMKKAAIAKTVSTAQSTVQEFLNKDTEEKVES